MTQSFIPWPRRHPWLQVNLITTFAADPATASSIFLTTFTETSLAWP